VAHARMERSTENWAAAGPSLIAAAGAVLASFVVRSLIGVPTPAEQFGDRLTQLIPLPIFSALLDTFGPNAKHLYFAALLVGEGVLTAIVGVLYCRWRPSLLIRLQPRRAAELTQEPALPEVLVLAALLWLLSAGVLAPLIGGGFFGAALEGGAGAILIAELVPNLTFAAILVLLLRRASVEAPSAPASDAPVSRRGLLRQGAIAVGILAGGALAWELISNALGLAGRRQYSLQTPGTASRVVPPPQPTYGPWTSVTGQTPEVTSAANFYYVSKNLGGDPSIQSSGWQLKIGGMVDQPHAVTYNDLLALPYIERYHTLECISNEVGGNLMSNALFRGVGLADLLNRAGIQSGASQLIFHASDGYSDFLHLSQALDPRSLVVYLINGQPLPQAHGFPARLLIPGLYGMKNGKWLTELELGAGTYTGYWEQQGWTREAHVKLTSRIDVPSDGDVLLARPTFIAGIAYAAAAGIGRVDVTVDGGRIWQPATLRQPLGTLTWVLWEYAWTPTSGTYVIGVRAIDLQGNIQTPNVAPPLPDGASGYHAIQVVVR
jgi:DMSO/TMAO reductase YedYZ molybdopterin-dependent catalytic subunit